MKVTINVPFTAQIETDSNGFGYIDHPEVSGHCYAFGAKAKRLLKHLLVNAVAEGLTAAKSTKGRVIGITGDVVFIVRYGIPGWHYAIAGQGRKGCGSCMIGPNTFDAAYAAALKHAGQMAADAGGQILYDLAL